MFWVGVVVSATLSSLIKKENEKVSVWGKEVGELSPKMSLIVM